MLQEMDKTLCLGLMSGTSLDGLDLCLVSFWKEEHSWKYDIASATTLPYSAEMRQHLSTVGSLQAEAFVRFENTYGAFLGEAASSFIQKNKCKPAFIASHGHTVFHQPSMQVTKQIGPGAVIAARTDITTVCDFRSLDVALGGQGAPLVPIGDERLFPQYDYCLNLGGFANISTNNNGTRLAYDICPVNIVMNQVTRRMGLEFDDRGRLARSGTVNDQLLSELNHLPFYTQATPKSLGREWVETAFFPVLTKYTMTEQDILSTLCEHAAVQLSSCIRPGTSVLVTGGGAYNDHLIHRFRSLSGANIIVPDDDTIQYKEALIFAFLGLLRMRGETNTLRSVTGASKDSIGGCVYLA